MLALVTGLVPCPLTTFILTYALAKGKLAVALAAIGGMLAGVIVTLVSFAVGAVLARGRFLAFLARTEALRQRVGPRGDGRDCGLAIGHCDVGKADVIISEPLQPQYSCLRHKLV